MTTNVCFGFLKVMFVYVIMEIQKEENNVIKHIIIVMLCKSKQTKTSLSDILMLTIILATN